MIKAIFQKENGIFRGVSVSGHAMFADSGSDIVCAGVSSAVELTANAITEVLKVSAGVAVRENEVVISLPDNADKEVANFMKALFIHLKNLENDYPKNIKVITTEV